VGAAQRVPASGEVGVAFGENYDAADGQSADQNARVR
jgi:hypothetical protein